jgi:hypothetical protein
MIKEILKSIENLDYIKSIKRDFDTNIFKFTNHDSGESSYLILVRKKHFSTPEEAFLMLFEKLLYEELGLSYIRFLTDDKEAFYTQNKVVEQISEMTFERGVNSKAISDFKETNTSFDAIVTNFIETQLTNSELFQVIKDWDCLKFFGYNDDYYFLYSWNTSA